MNSFDNTTRGAKIILKLLNLQIHVKIFHWYTTSYSNHKSSNNLGGDLSKLIDSFIEKYIGVYGKSNIYNMLTVQNLNKTKYIDLLKESREYLSGLTIKDSGVSNVRDELVGSLDKALYLSGLS